MVAERVQADGAELSANREKCCVTQLPGPLAYKLSAWPTQGCAPRDSEGEPRPMTLFLLIAYVVLGLLALIHCYRTAGTE